MFGTKCPSITSKCNHSTSPVSTTLLQLQPKFAKSAANIDGAIIGLTMLMLEEGKGTTATNFFLLFYVRYGWIGGVDCFT